MKFWKLNFNKQRTYLPQNNSISNRKFQDKFGKIMSILVISLCISIYAVDRYGFRDVRTSSHSSQLFLHLRTPILTKRSIFPRHSSLNRVFDRCTSSDRYPILGHEHQRTMVVRRQTSCFRFPMFLIVWNRIKVSLLVFRGYNSTGIQKCNPKVTQTHIEKENYREA